MEVFVFFVVLVWMEGFLFFLGVVELGLYFVMVKFWNDVEGIEGNNFFVGYCVVDDVVFYVFNVVVVFVYEVYYVDEESVFVEFFEGIVVVVYEGVFDEVEDFDFFWGVFVVVEVFEFYEYFCIEFEFLEFFKFFLLFDFFGFVFKEFNEFFNVEEFWDWDDVFVFVVKEDIGSGIVCEVVGYVVV